MFELRRLFRYVLPYWPRMAIASLALFVGSALGLALPWVIRLLVDSVFVARNTDLLNWIGFGLVALFVVQSVLNFFQNYLMTFVGQRVVADLRLAIHQRLLFLPLRFFDNRRVGEMVSRVTNDATVIQETLVDTPVNLLRQLVTFVGGVALMVAMNWQLALLILVIIPPLMAIGLLFGRVLERLATEVQDRQADSTTVLEETLSGIRVVKSFGREAYEQDRFGAQVEAAFRKAMQRTRVHSLFGPLVGLLGYGSITLILWFGGRQVIAGEITPGELIAFLFYMMMVAGPLSEFAGMYSRLREALGASRRIFEIMGAAVEPLDPAAAVAPAHGQVRFVGVHFGYADAASVLDGIDLCAQPGEVVALVGPSGVGKTTLVNLIPRFYEPAEGRIELDGTDIRSIRLASLRAQIALVPQDNFLFGGTVRENISYGRLNAPEEEIMQAARAAFADDFIRALPKGYDTVVGERGVKLSAGERQRIAIARALLKDPRILILDEATSSLDTESERLVQAALDRLMQGRTSFVIAHRLPTVQRADRILVLRGGRIVEQGRHDELLARQGLYHRLWNLQFAAPEDTSWMPLLA